MERCWQNTRLAVALHWGLIVDCDGPNTRKFVGRMQTQLYSKLQQGNRVGHEAVNGQVRFKAFMDQFSKEVRGRTSCCLAVAVTSMRQVRMPYVCATRTAGVVALSTLDVRCTSDTLTETLHCRWQACQTRPGPSASSSRMS